MSGKFKIAVIDDSWAVRKSYYQKLASKDDLEIEFIESAAALRTLSEGLFDGFIVDLNLSEWGLTATEVINKYISNVRKNAPIFLISAHLSNNAFNVQAQLAREAAGAAYGDTFAWEDYAAKRDGVLESSALEPVYQRVVRVLSGWYAQSTLLEKPDVRILHLSDPQFGDPSLNGELRFNEEIISAALFELLDDKVAEGNMVDFVVISGDITYSGQESEFQKAYKWIVKSLLPKLFPAMPLVAAQERLYICPGNHDVNLRAMALERMRFNFAWPGDRSQSILKPSEDAEPTYRRHGLKNYYEFLCSLDREAAKSVKQGSSLNWVSNRFFNAGFQFLILNTASEITCEAPSQAAIDDDEVSEIKNQLSAVSNEASKVVVCIGHHPLRSSRQGQQVVKDGEKLLLMFKGRQISLYLHGHAHEYGVDELVPNKCVSVLAATSNVGVNNGRQGFNLLTLSRRKNGRPNKLDIEICEFHAAGRFQWLTMRDRVKRFSYK